MPELPEVETSRRGIAPWLVEQQVRRITIRERRLRWPVPRVIDRKLPGSFIRALNRRAKYLLFETEAGTLMLHLGMSGSLRIIDPGEPPGKHDHVDIELGNGKALRFRDPRRFGSLLWTSDPQRHPLLAGLGPEPLSSAFDGAYLWNKARGRRIAVKSFIMNAAIVVGVGNIYASESLFRAQIHPKRRADRISAANGVMGMLTVLAAALPLAATAQVENYNIDPYHTYPYFELEHLGTAMLRGRFDKTAGKFSIDRTAKTATLEIVIQAASVTTGDNDRDGRPRTRRRRQDARRRRHQLRA